MDIKPPRRTSSTPPAQSPGQPANAAGPAVGAPQTQPAPLVSPDESLSKRKKYENWRSVFSTILLFLLAPVIAVSIAAFALQSYQVDGQSMETTLQNRDRLIVDKIPRTWARITHHDYIPKRGDIVVFNQAGLFDASGLAEKQLIKRVIGLPGDHVVIKNGKITIYNALHPGGFDPDTTGKYKITAPTTPGDIDLTLQPGQIFVCGDNRTNSEDSRYFGPVNADRIVGQLVLRIVPFNKAEKF